MEEKLEKNETIIGKNLEILDVAKTIAKEKGMLLMICDQCAVRRNLAEGTLEQCGSGDVKPKGLAEGVHVGCFPQLYTALSGNMPDQVITL